jgi:hypothetical protein
MEVYWNSLERKKIEFHLSWYEIIGQYSVRNLTKSSDKLKVMSGIAFFIQRNTKFQYICGLWLEVLPINLLWTRMGRLQNTLSCSTPTWSWASVNGKISHRLRVAAKKEMDSTRFKSTWKELTPLISDCTVEATEEVNDLILNATLKLQGYLHEFESDKFNVIYDTWLPTSRRKLCCLPILSFENDLIHPLNSKTQLHGIVLQIRLDSNHQYERVGYFWTAKAEAIQEIMNNIEKRSEIEIA